MPANDSVKNLHQACERGLKELFNDVSSKAPTERADEDAVFSSLVAEIRATIEEISLQAFKKQLRRGDFTEAFFCWSR